MTYGCEIWGYQSLELVSKFQLRFLKLALGAYKTTPSCMILGELGCFPIKIEIQGRILAFWYKLMIEMQNGVSKLSCTMLKLQLRLLESGEHIFPWLNHVKTLLDNLGLTYLWNRQSVSLNAFKKLIKQRLKDQYIQMWSDDVNNNNVCFNYRMYKKDFKFESYLINLDNPMKDYMMKFRFSNHKLPIHSQRFIGIEREERVCEFCDTGEIGDEFHYLFKCKDVRIVSERNKFLSNYFFHRPNAIKYNITMNVQSPAKQLKLARFIGFILKLFKSTN